MTLDLFAGVAVSVTSSARVVTSRLASGGVLWPATLVLLLGGSSLSARALYLHTVNGNDTAIRIHGTTDPGSIGRAVSNGCIRMRNEAVMDLYDKVPIGAPVYVY